MMAAFTSEPIIYDENGEPYPNPIADIHLKTTVDCIAPDWFIGVPDNKLLKRSKEIPSGQKVCPRDLGKRLNFAELYLATAQSIAELNRVPIELAKEWDARHKQTYKGYYAWAAEVGRIARARGWAPNARGRVRWVDEANSKGAGESIERNAVNHMVQSQI